jgi:hypothetical protein
MVLFTTITFLADSFYRDWITDLVVIVPLFLVVLSAIMGADWYNMFFMVIRQNRLASRFRSQKAKVIDTGFMVFKTPITLSLY